MFPLKGICLTLYSYRPKHKRNSIVKRLSITGKRGPAGHPTGRYEKVCQQGGGTLLLSNELNIPGKYVPDMKDY